MPQPSAILETNIHRFAAGIEENAVDHLAVEEPLEIRIAWTEGGKAVDRPISITMRTPGGDEDLAAGFLLTEGIVTRREQIASIRRTYRRTRKRSLPIAGVASHTSNTVVVELSPDVAFDPENLQRHFYTTSSCGVCGKASIEALRTNARPIRSSLIVDQDVINSLPEHLRERQDVFDSTGGLHASALFTSGGDLDIVCEDVGRHNALDKVIGSKFMSGETPLGNCLLLVSGRASFELVQKTVVAGIPVLAAVGAPSSLAVELAREFDLTLVGFLRDEKFNVYTGHQRIRAQPVGKQAASLR